METNQNVNSNVKRWEDTLKSMGIHTYSTVVADVKGFDNFHTTGLYTHKTTEAVSSIELYVWAKSGLIELSIATHSAREIDLVVAELEFGDVTEFITDFPSVVEKYMKREDNAFSNDYPKTGLYPDLEVKTYYTPQLCVNGMDYVDTGVFLQTVASALSGDAFLYTTNGENGAQEAYYIAESLAMIYRAITYLDSPHMERVSDQVRVAISNAVERALKWDFARAILNNSK